MNAQGLLAVVCAGVGAATMAMTACSSPDSGQLSNQGLPPPSGSSGGGSGGGSGGFSSSGGGGTDSSLPSPDAASHADAPQETGPMVDPNAPIHFTLLDTAIVNADAGSSAIQGYDPMPDGVTIDESKVGTTLSIRADPKAMMGVGSVHFTLDGMYTHTENSAPYTLCGDDGKGTVNPCPLGGDGAHWVTATIYSEPDLGGVEGASVELHYTIAGAPIADAGGQ